MNKLLYGKEEGKGGRKGEREKGKRRVSSRRIKLVPWRNFFNFVFVREGKMGKERGRNRKRNRLIPPYVVDVEIAQKRERSKIENNCIVAGSQRDERWRERNGERRGDAVPDEKVGEGGRKDVFHAFAFVHEKVS